MASLQEIHDQSYKDMPFEEFAQRYHQKFYSDLPFDQFIAKAAPGAVQQSQAAPEDPIKAEVRGEIERDRAKGMPGTQAGIGRQFLQGGTFGTADELLAAATTPLEMIKRGTFNPVKGYEYAKAREDLLLEDARKRGGAVGTGMEILGGGGMGMGLAKAGATFMPQAGAGIARNVGGMAADGAAYGAITGATEGEGLEGRAKGALTGGLAGGAAGGALGAAAPVVSAVGRNALGWVSAARDPAGYAERQLARALAESGRTPREIAQEVAAGGAAGQPFTVADALGNSGQRMLSTVARNPGEGRTAVVDFLEGRQAGQGRRIADALGDAFNAPTTSAQSKAAREAIRTSVGNTNYGIARDLASNPVDVGPALTNIAREMPPQIPAGGSDTVDVINRIRGKLTDANGSPITNFNTLLNAKKEIDSIISTAVRTGDKNTARIAELAAGPLDDALANASSAYSRARDTFRVQSQAIDAIDEGKSAATRGRLEDTTQRFSEMRTRARDPQGYSIPASDQRQAFREGYVDPIIERIQNGAVGVNKAREFTSDASRAELNAFAAPGKRSGLADALNRETRMFETRGQALGGSKTADNLADSDAMGVNPEVIASLLQGNFLQAGKNIVGRSSATLSGNTTEVRKRLAEALLRTDNPQLQTVLERTYSSEAKRQEAIAQALRGLLASGASGTASVSNQRR